MKLHIVVLSIFFDFAFSRDFYVGMFKKNDLLVAQDSLYKESRHFGFTTAKYGRQFKCPITYLRVADRLGNQAPHVEIIRGGLQKKYIVLRLTGSYGQPIAVNIYVGCENKMKTMRPNIKPIATTYVVETTVTEAGTTAGGDDGEKTTQVADGEPAKEDVTPGAENGGADEVPETDKAPASKEAGETETADAGEAGGEAEEKVEEEPPAK